VTKDNKPPRKPFPAALAHLKAISGWVIWRWVETKPGKFTKPPFQPRHPDRNASNRNPAHWSDFKTAIARVREDRAKGTGFVVSASPDECWIDVDDCRNKETGALNEFAQRLLRLTSTYAEITPSGEGIRIVGTLTGSYAAKPIHKPYKIAGGGKGEVFFHAHRYVTITGDRLPDVPDELAPVDEIVSLILRESVISRDGAGVSTSTDLIPVPGSDDPVLDIDTRPPMNLSLDQIATYLAKLPPHDAKDEAGESWWTRDRWLQVIFAVHDDTHGSEDGYSLLDAWCAATPFYDPDGLRVRWDSARGSAGGEARVSIRTVIKWANDWTKPQRDNAFNDLVERISTANNRQELEDCAEEARGLQIDTTTGRAMLISHFRIAFRRIVGTSLPENIARRELAFRDPNVANMPPWLRSFCWVSGIKKFYDAQNGQLYDSAGFDITFGKRFMTPEEIAQGADTPSVSPTGMATNRFQVPVVAALGYRPESESVGGSDDGLEDFSDDDGNDGVRKPRIYVMNGLRYVNRFHTRGAVPSKHGPWTDQEKEDIKLILSLYRRVCGTERDTMILLSFLHSVIILRKRVRFCIVLSSAEGTGKTTALSTIPALLIGQENVGVYQPNVLMDRSDGSWMDGHLLKVIEEVWVHEAARAAVIERMKPVITNDTVSPRFMYEGTRNVLNTASYIGLTNHPDVLALTSKDTRFYPIQPVEVQTAAQVDALIAADPGYYGRVRAAIRRSLPAFKGWLETKFRPHPDFHAPNGRAPESETKQRVIEEAREPLERDIMDLLRQELHPLITPDVVCVRTLQRFLLERGVQIMHGGEKKRMSEVLSVALRRLDFQARGQFRLSCLTNQEDELDDTPADNRTRIYTSGVGPLDKGTLTSGRIDAYVELDGL